MLIFLISKILIMLPNLCDMKKGKLKRNKIVKPLSDDLSTVMVFSKWLGSCWSVSKVHCNIQESICTHILCSVVLKMSWVFSFHVS